VLVENGMGLGMMAGCGIRSPLAPDGGLSPAAGIRAPLAARDLLAPEDKTPQGIILDFVILPTAGQQCPLLPCRCLETRGSPVRQKCRAF
jgi:hypothetical protein